MLHAGSRPTERIPTKRRVIERTLLALIAAVSLVAGARSRAGDDPAQAPANRASVDAALAAVQRAHPGRVLKAALEREGGGPAAWVYEMKVLTEAGDVLEVKVDAVSLKVLGVEGGRPGRSDDD